MPRLINARLIADAPSLLALAVEQAAEIERLRGVLAEIGEYRSTFRAASNPAVTLAAKARAALGATK